MSLIPETGNALVQFGAEWCAPCKALRPHVEGLAPGLHAAFVYVDVEKHHEIASRYSVRAMPTVVMLKDGAEVGRVNGNAPGQVRSVALAAFKA